MSIRSTFVRILSVSSSEVPGGSGVIEHERPFVHFRHEVVPDVRVEPVRPPDNKERSRNNDPPAGEQPGERAPYHSPRTDRLSWRTLRVRRSDSRMTYDARSGASVIEKRNEIRSAKTIVTESDAKNAPVTRRGTPAVYGSQSCLQSTR